MNPTESVYPSILPSASPSEKGTEPATDLGEDGFEDNVIETDNPSANPSSQPTSMPSAAPSSGVFTQDIPACEAMAVDGFNRARMCESSDPCCQEVRTDSNYCWEIYDLSFPNMDMREVCGKCCGLNVSPNFFATPKQNLPQTIMCSDFNVQRYCGAGGCCDNHETGFCKDEHDDIEISNPGQQVFEQICVSFRKKQCLVSLMSSTKLMFCLLFFPCSTIVAQCLPTTVIRKLLSPALL